MSGIMIGEVTHVMRNTLTIYLPQKHQDKKALERLQKLSKKLDRSVNYLAVQANLNCLDRQTGSLPPR